jgi:hypothetical protein
LNGTGTGTPISPVPVRCESETLARLDDFKVLHALHSAESIV